MSRRYVLRCQSCREPILAYRADGRIDIDGLKVSIDPTADEGVTVSLRCRCGAERQWTVRERIRPVFAEVRRANRVH